MALLLHYTGQDYISRGLLKTELTPGSTSAIVGGCKTGKGFSFDDTANSALYVNNIGVSMPTKFTVSCWFLINNLTDIKTIFANGQLHNSGFQLDVYDNAVRAFGYSTDDNLTLVSSSKNSISANTWYHVTAGVDGGRFFLYLNSSFVRESIMTGTIRTNYSPRIGYRFNSLPFSGQICNFKYYNHVLSQKEINEDYKSLMLHYKLDKPITTQVFDHSGFNRHITNLVNTKTNEAVGKVYGGSLKSVSGSVCHGGCNLTDWNGINEMSFACRFKVSELKQNYLFWNMNYTGNGSGFYAVVNPTSIQFHLCGTGFLNNYSWIIDTWYSVVLVKSPTTIYIYVNNVLINSIASTTSSFSHTYTTYIAERPDTPSYNLNGNIQDIRFYAKALTQEDVTELYKTRQEIDNQGKLWCSEIVENAKYPSKYWHTPSYAEMNYILNTRTNASNLRTLGRVDINGNGTYVNGCFLLPDDWVLPAGVLMTITTANYTTNSYLLEDFKKLELSGAVFLAFNYCRNNISFNSYCSYVLGSSPSSSSKQDIAFRSPENINDKLVFPDTSSKLAGSSIRLCRTSSKGFSTSATTKIDFAPANLQYHCTQHIWRFAEHSYDFIGAANANISDTYNGWIDLFGYGTSGVNYSPTLHSTNSADYASGDISNTDNDWGANEISEGQSEVEMKANGQLYCDEVIENDDGTFSINQNKTIKTKEIKEV